MCRFPGEVTDIVALWLTEMLHDESSEVDLVGPTLPSLKTLCEQASKSVRAGSDLLQRAVHGFLSAALQNIDDMR